MGKGLGPDPFPVGIQKSSGKGFLMGIARIDRLMIVGIIAASWSIFQIYTGFFGVLAPLQQRAIHLTFALVLAYLITPMKKSLPKDHLYWDQLLLAILSACVGGYITHHHLGLAKRRHLYRSGNWIGRGGNSINFGSDPPHYGLRPPPHRSGFYHL